MLKNFNFNIFKCTDSKVVLSWLSTHPLKWENFLANGTSQITGVLPTKHWRHVLSKENSEDIVSSGIHQKCLSECDLWWKGPSWLFLDTSN